MDQVKSIVVGVDFSPCSASAVAQAIRIAQWNQASVHVVHIIERLGRERASRFGTLNAEVVDAHVLDESRRMLNRMWRDFAARIPGAEDLEFQIEIAHPVIAILRCLRDYAADLLILGMHGASEFAIGTGTLATACIRKAPTRVLLVREAQAGPFSSIIACIDFSEASRSALEQATRVALQDDARLHVLHVDYDPGNPLYMYQTMEAELDKAIQERLTQRLREFCEPFHTEMSYLAANYSVLTHQRPGYAIIEHAWRVNADLIALGTRGRTNLRDMLWGSTAERVVRATQCSALTVNPLMPEQLLAEAPPVAAWQP